MNKVSSNDADEALERQPLLLNGRHKMGDNVKEGINRNNKNNDGSIRSRQKVNCCERRRRRKGLKEYYENLDRLQEFYRADEERLCQLDFDHLAHKKTREEESEKKQRMDKILARIVFVLNVVLLFTNLAAAFLSGSYSVISAFIDNAMDLMSSFIVQLTVWSISNTNMFNYPRGRERLEIIAVIVCSTIMGVTNIMMIIQSVEAILNNEVHPSANLPTICLLLGGIGSKVLLAVICYSKQSSGSRLLAMDLRNDVITSGMALAGAYVGDKYWPFADPIGAILVCTFIAISWFANVFSTIPWIVGRRADQEHISRILRITIEHDSRIRALDHVMVYHLGERALVELHVVLDEHLPLKICHDLTEALDRKIRSLDFVERVFVHVDYQLDGDS